MKIKSLVTGVLIVLLLSLSGCATIFSGSTQNVNVSAINANTNRVIPNAVCSIADGKGQVYALSSNPGSTIVSRGKGALSVRCTKSNYRQTQIGVAQNVNPWIIANILFWPGIIVDAITGAIVKYPSQVNVLMEPAKS